MECSLSLTILLNGFSLKFMFVSVHPYCEIFFFFSSRRRHTRCSRDLEFRRVLFRSCGPKDIGDSNHQICRRQARAIAGFVHPRKSSTTHCAARIPEMAEKLTPSPGWVELPAK